MRVNTQSKVKKGFKVQTKETLEMLGQLAIKVQLVIKDRLVAMVLLEIKGHKEILVIIQ